MEGTTEEEKAVDLSQRIDRAEWDWNRFKNAPAAQEILKEMRAQQEHDGGPKLP